MINKYKYNKYNTYKSHNFIVFLFFMCVFIVCLLIPSKYNSILFDPAIIHPATFGFNT